MNLAKRFAFSVLGIILIAVFVVAWKYATGAMTLFVENFWCTSLEKTEVCRFRGYQHFLIWTVIGIINLLIWGLLFDRLVHRSR